MQLKHFINSGQIKPQNNQLKYFLILSMLLNSYYWFKHSKLLDTSMNSQNDMYFSYVLHLPNFSMNAKFQLKLWGKETLKPYLYSLYIPFTIH